MADGLDKVERRYGVPPSVRLIALRLLAPAVIALPVLIFALSVWLQPAPAGATSRSVEVVWGKAPYNPEVQAFAEWCVSGGPLPERCERDGVWMEGEHAAIIAATEPISEEQLRFRRSRRASGPVKWLRLIAHGLWNLPAVFARVGDYAGWAILALGGQAVLLGWWLWLFRPPRPCRVVVGARGVRIDGELIPAEELLGCIAEKGSLRLWLTGGRQQATPPLDAGELALEQLAVDIRALVLSSEERAAREANRERVEAGHREMQAKAGRESGV